MLLFIVIRGDTVKQMIFVQRVCARDFFAISYITKITSGTFPLINKLLVYQR